MRLRTPAFKSGQSEGCPLLAERTRNAQEWPLDLGATIAFLQGIVMKTPMVLIHTSLTTLAFTGLACGQSSETLPAYCGSGSAALALGSGTAMSRLAEVRQKCRPGDTIFVPTANPAVIAKICDFSRTIVSTGYDVVCVVTAVRPDR